MWLIRWLQVKAFELAWHEGYSRGWKDCEQQAVEAVLKDPDWIKACRNG